MRCHLLELNKHYEFGKTGRVDRGLTQDRIAYSNNSNTRHIIEVTNEPSRKDRSYSQRVLEISLPHRCLPQDDRKYIGRGHQETLGRSFGRRALSNATLRHFVLQQEVLEESLS
ncbi:hypothetical protein AVEN_149128-1 [Araneus ventricosus]|uniref:Uncharacterized protein n=1 Tax=Araneus ventricosus TaxID=182803 RepID=A0A4Y2HB95_ARAVE|nr:hypothetical protein AVEN_149128-1 [Araneus ventricosus]